MLSVNNSLTAVGITAVQVSEWSQTAQKIYSANINFLVGLRCGAAWA